MKLDNDFKFLMAKYEYEKENYELVLGICDELIKEGYVKAYGLKGLAFFYLDEKEAIKIFEEGTKKGDLISKFFKLVIEGSSFKEASKILRQTNEIPLNDVIGILISHIGFDMDEFFLAIIYSYALKDVKEMLVEYLDALHSQNDKRVEHIKRFLVLVDEIDNSHINVLKEVLC